MSFTVYKSSAGSGKTFTLVKEYLKIALSDEHSPPRLYKKILAITFTNKAAAEMKERIIKALKMLSVNNPGKEVALLNILQKELNLPTHIIAERAEKVLEAILHNYSDFGIGTIDSFVHKVIRTFAFDLKIPINFNIETDSAKLLSEAVDILISRIGTDENLTKVLIEFAESKTDEEKNWHIEYDLQNLAGNLLKEEAIEHIKSLKRLSVTDFFNIRNKILKEIKTFENSVVEIAKKANDIIENKNISAASFYQGEKGITKYFKNIAKQKFDKVLPNSYVTATITEDKWTSGKASVADKNSIEEIKAEITDLYNKLQEIITEGYSEYILFNLINKNIYALTVLNEIEKILEEFKMQNNILHISEFNKLISGIISSQPVPFIYERLGEKYHNYLIDEFQDTSVLQWHNLLPLIDNSLAEDHFTMIVGDGKQSIYRWRGGEVEQFTKLPEVHAHGNNPLVKEREASLQRSYLGKNLSNNFRSKREIIKFNNSFFKTLSSKLSLNHQKIYEGLEQGFPENNTGGYVSIELIEGDKEEKKRQYLFKTSEIIKRLLSDNYSYKDIAILVRRNTDGKAIADFLTSEKIPVISSESLLLKKSRMVNFIYAVMKYLHNPQDNIAKAAILEFLVFNKKINETYHAGIGNIIYSSDLYALDNFLKANNISFQSNFLTAFPIYEMCEELVRIFRLNETNDAYVQFFLNEVLTYTTKNNNTLSDFIDWWSEESYQPSVAVPDGLNAVTIMTIHRSKGLEFPAVIFPFADWSVEHGNKQLWINPENKKIPELEAAIVSTSSQLENTQFAELYAEEKNKSLLDNVNILYVALTRPEERLYILSSSPGKQPDKVNCVNDMFGYYLKQSGMWSESQATYEFGSLVKHINNHKKKNSELFVPGTLHSNSWRDKIRIKTSSSSIWKTEDTEIKKSKGLLLHNILSKIKTANNIDEVLKTFYNEGIIDKNEFSEFSKSITRLLNIKEINPFFKEGLNVKTEAELILPDGSLFRPDRVVLYEDKAVVIDFKTGKPSEKHRDQLNKYGEILTGMGQAKTEKYLVYLEDEKVIQVA